MPGTQGAESSDDADASGSSPFGSWRHRRILAALIVVVAIAAAVALVVRDPDAGTTDAVGSSTSSTHDRDGSPTTTDDGDDAPDEDRATDDRGNGDTPADDDHGDEVQDDGPPGGTSGSSTPSPTGSTSTVPDLGTRPDPLRWVALGDSYASGHGHRPYAPDTGCTQSTTTAYPLVAADVLERAGRDIQVVLAACSGAQAPDLARQASAVDGETDLVTVTIGGNDAGFSDLVAACLLTSQRGDPADDPCHVDDDGVDAIGDEVHQRVRDGLAPVLDRLPDGAAVVLVGYPNLVPTSGACAPLGEREVERVTDIVQELDATLRAVARELVQVQYTSALRTFADHHVCADEPWLWGLDPPERARDAPLHPNADGVEAYAHLLLRHLALT